MSTRDPMQRVKDAQITFPRLTLRLMKSMCTAVKCGSGLGHFPEQTGPVTSLMLIISVSCSHHP